MTTIIGVQEPYSWIRHCLIPKKQRYLGGRRMIRFIGKRILQMIPVVLLVATLIFGILYLVPGDRRSHAGEYSVGI